MSKDEPTVRSWWVACPILNRFVQAELTSRSSAPGPGAFVYLTVDGHRFTVPAADYERAAEYHNRTHKAQLDDFRRAAHSKTLGTIAFWAVYAWGHYRHGFRRNPLEQEARAAEDAAFSEGKPRPTGKP